MTLLGKTAAVVTLGAVLAGGATAARAAAVAKDSPLGALVGLVMAIHACETHLEPGQMTEMQTTGEALQKKVGASDDDLEAVSKEFGDGKPAIGCDKFNADFAAELAAAVAAAK